MRNLLGTWLTCGLRNCDSGASKPSKSPGDRTRPEPVTSRSGTLRTLILWGHLLASDLDLLMLDLIYWLWCDWQTIWCVTIQVCGCFWLSWLSVQVCDLEDAEAPVDPLGLRTESGSVLLGWFVYYDVDLIWWFDDDILTWLFWWCRLTIACRLDSHME